MCNKENLPGLEQALEMLQEIEKKVDEGSRIAQTRRALEKNERITQNKKVVEGYYQSLIDKGLFVPIYGAGDLPWALPLHMPPYLIEILWATSRVLYALARKHLKDEGPDYLIKRMPEGWITEEMAEILHRYYLTVEPDLAFDVLDTAPTPSAAWPLTNLKLPVTIFMPKYWRPRVWIPTMDGSGSAFDRRETLAHMMIPYSPWPKGIIAHLPMQNWMSRSWPPISTDRKTIASAFFSWRSIPGTNPVFRI